MAIYLIVALIAYLLGSIPFGYILLRVFRGEDVREHGSGNIGATNVARKAPGLGIATLVLDALKGWTAVIISWPIIVMDNEIFWCQHGIQVYGINPYAISAIAAMFAI